MASVCFVSLSGIAFAGTKNNPNLIVVSNITDNTDTRIIVSPEAVSSDVTENLPLSDKLDPPVPETSLNTEISEEIPAQTEPVDNPENTSVKSADTTSASVPATVACTTNTATQPPQTADPETQNNDVGKSDSESTLIITDCTYTVNRGKHASITVKGVPNTEYECKVKYKSGYSSAKGLGKATSDSNGFITWSWRIGVNTSTSFKPVITVTGNGQTVTCEITILE